jgi:hypothetical protein
MTENNSISRTNTAKRPYTTPCLSSLGSFAVLTLGNTGAKGDGGPGLSKA